MAGTAFIKGTGLLLFLLLQLQPLLYVSGQNTPATTAPPSSAAPTSAGSTTMQSTTVMSTGKTQSGTTTTMAVSTRMSTTVPVTTTTQMSSSMVTSTVMSSPVGQSSAPVTSSTSGSSTGVMSTTNMTTGSNLTATVNSTADNTTTANSTTSSMNSTISCLKLSCNYSDCYSMSMNMTATPCATNIQFCEMRIEVDMTYTIGCKASCSDVTSCVNATRNCTVNCCNSTDCLNSTLATMDPSTTTSVTTMRMTTTNTKPAAPATTAANNGKVCHTFQCSTADCYKNNKNTKLCTNNQKHCELKNITTSSKTIWKAGCSVNCSGETWCPSTKGACHLECCNATTTSSCLKLDGTLNVPSSATRGPYSIPIALMGYNFPIALTAFALLACLLSIGSLV